MVTEPGKYFMKCVILESRPAPKTTSESEWKNVCYLDAEFSIGSGKIIVRNLLVKCKQDEKGERFFFAPKAVQINDKWESSIQFVDLPAMEALREAFIKSMVPGVGYNSQPPAIQPLDETPF